MKILKVKPQGCLRTLHFKSKKDVKPGELVIIPHEGGGKLAEVIPESIKIKEELKKKNIPEIIRHASEKDIETFNKKKIKEEKALQFCRKRIIDRGLPMKALETLFYLDGKKSIFYFTAEGRVDFRDLVKDLARKYKMRIEMRQVGVRDETQLRGGYGVCGKPLCCYTFLKEFEPVSLQTAKDQNLNVNPTKISGICGRLICCLNYEEEASGRLFIDQDDDDLIQYDEEQIESEEEFPEVLKENSDKKNPSNK